MTFEELKPILRKVPVAELIKTADYLLDFATDKALKDTIEYREALDNAPEPRNNYERWPGVVTYPNY